MMARKETWSQRVTKADARFLDKAIEAYRIRLGLKTKGEALVHLIRNLPEPTGDALEPEVVSPGERSFESICPFKLLKKLNIDHHGEGWYCLKQQGLESRGSPQWLGSDKERVSVRAICEACVRLWETKPIKKGLDEIVMAIHKFGESEVTSQLYFCTHNYKEMGIRMITSESATIFCTLRGRRVTVGRTCKAKKCPFLLMKIVNFNVDETLPYKKMQDALEDLR